MDLNSQAMDLGLEADEFLELVEIFVESTDADLSRLESGLSSGSSEEVAEAAHSIKGAAAGLGFEDASTLAKKIETNARQNILEGSGKDAQAIKSELATINEAFRTSRPSAQHGG